MRSARIWSLVTLCLVGGGLLEGACAPSSTTEPHVPATPPSAGATTSASASAPSTPKAPPEKLTASSPRRGSMGTAFTAPGGWSLSRDGALVVLESPEADTHLVIVETKSKSADAAFAAAWSLYKPGAQVRPVHLTTQRTARKGWEERVAVDYETSPNEKAVVYALAQRRGDLWVVLIVDASEATHGRRGAQIGLVDDTLFPDGYQRETFAGKKPRALDKARIQEITDFVEDAQKQLGVPGVAISLIEGDKVVFEGGFGVRELGKPAKIDANTQFAIASNTKGMATLLLAKLVDEKKLTWDTPVVSVYPGFKLGDAETTSKVLIKHLVCACTGLPRQDFEWIFEYGKITPKSAMDLLGTMQPTSKFGEVFQYSNILAAAAGYVAAHVISPGKELGAAFDDAMRVKVFEPLGMKGATFDLARVERGNHARPHADDVDGKPVVAKMDLNHSVIPVRPAGGAWMSTHDLARYVQLELGKGTLDKKRIVSEESLLARRAPQIAIGADGAYGMGLSMDSSFGVPVVHHGGALFGYKSDWFILPEQGIGAVILTNADNGRAMLRPFMRRVMEVLFEGKAEATEDIATRQRNRVLAVKKERERLVVPADPNESQKLAARYSSEALGQIVIRRDGGNTVFDFGEFASPMATRKNDDGTLSYITLIPTLVGGGDFVVGERGGKRVFIVRDAQHEYVFTEAP